MDNKDVRMVIAHIVYGLKMRATIEQIYRDLERYRDKCNGDYGYYRLYTLPWEESIISTSNVHTNAMILLFNTIAWNSEPYCRHTARENIPGTIWYLHYSGTYIGTSHRYWVRFCSDMNGLYCYIIS